MMPETMKTMGTEMRASMRVVGALPGFGAGLDAGQAQPQGRAAYAGARGQARREQVEATRDESDGENQEGGD